MSRGVDRHDIFLDDRDRRRFLRLLAVAIPHFRWRLHAYVLMSNHYHLLAETVEPTLSRGIKNISGDYALWFNKRHHRVGHLFQGRFKAHLIDSDEYLLQVARYIVLNPVRGHMVESAIEWPWSSARATAGCAVVPSWLTTSAILDRFHSDREMARTLYRVFVQETRAQSPWRGLVGQIYLGGAHFVEDVQKRIDEQSRSDEHPRVQTVVRRAPIQDVRDAVEALTNEPPSKSGSRVARLAYAELAHSESLAPLREIGATLGVGPSATWRLVHRARQLERTDPIYAELIARLRLKIRK